MKRAVQVVGLARGELLETALVVDARFKESEPFSGIFEILSKDLFLTKGANGRSRVATVFCDLTFGGEEYCMLELEVDGFAMPLPDDYEGYVIAVIELVKVPINHPGGTVTG